jgi:hypothetical protein
MNGTTVKAMPRMTGLSTFSPPLIATWYHLREKSRIGAASWLFCRKPFHPPRRVGGTGTVIFCGLSFVTGAIMHM